MTVVIDVGCARYGGDFSIERLIHEFKPVMVYGFDPNDEIVASAPEGSERVNETRWVTPEGVGVALEKKAAWTYDGEIGYRSDTLNSWITDAVDAPKVECFDLARFIVERAGRDPSQEIVLKMDAEGAEYDLLDHLIETRADALLKLAWIEWHPKKVQNGNRRRQQIEEQIACEIVEWRW